MMTGRHSLIVGGDSCIGKTLAVYLAEKGEAVLVTSRRPDSPGIRLDLQEDVTDWQVPGNIAVAYLCAGQTSLSACRVKSAESEKINVHNTKIIADKLASAGAFLVYLSTNLVFDGLKPFCTESDRPNPVTIYGRQKTAAEEALCSVTNSLAILRMTKVVWPGFPRFRNWMSALRQHQEIEALSDLSFSPVDLDLVVSIMFQLAVSEASGIWHLSGSKDISYWDAAHFMARQIGVDSSLVTPSTIDKTEMAEVLRPGFSALDTNKLRGEFGIAAPDPRDTIHKCILE